MILTHSITNAHATCTHTHMHSLTCTHMHSITNAHATCTHTCTHSHTHTCVYIYTHMHSLTCTHSITKMCTQHTHARTILIQLSGYPLHFSYASILHIVSAVEQTGLHLTENRRAEFSLSVYVHPYPNDVVSVWVFIVTMVPK